MTGFTRRGFSIVPPTLEEQLREQAQSPLLGWAARAYRALAIFARSHAEFGAPDVRAAVEGVLLPRAPDERAWGPVFQRARRAGLVAPAGPRRWTSRISRR